MAVADDLARCLAKSLANLLLARADIRSSLAMVYAQLRTGRLNDDDRPSDTEWLLEQTEIEVARSVLDLDLQRCTGELLREIGDVMETIERVLDNGWAVFAGSEEESANVQMVYPVRPVTPPDGDVLAWFALLEETCSVLAFRLGALVFLIPEDADEFWPAELMTQHRQFLLGPVYRYRDGGFGLDPEDAAPPR